MEKNKLGIIILFWGIIILMVWSPWNSTSNNDIKIDFSDGICRDRLYTTSELKLRFPNITQETVDEFNSVPTCVSICKQQLEYSKKYDDWFADRDIREICTELNIILPNNKN